MKIKRIQREIGRCLKEYLKRRYGKGAKKTKKIVGLIEEHKRKDVMFTKITGDEEEIIRELFPESTQLRISKDSWWVLKLYFCKDSLYAVHPHYTDEEAELLILEFEDKERKKFERLQTKFKLARELEKEPKRKPIPEEVRIAVWRRDEGKCARCDSRGRLEYHHIIPFSKGGSDTERNIELLCEQCNREQGNDIG